MLLDCILACIDSLQVPDLLVFALTNCILLLQPGHLEPRWILCYFMRPFLVILPYVANYLVIAFGVINLQHHAPNSETQAAEASSPSQTSALEDTQTTQLEMPAMQKSGKWMGQRMPYVQTWLVDLHGSQLPASCPSSHSQTGTTATAAASPSRLERRSLVLAAATAAQTFEECIEESPRQGREGQGPPGIWRSNWRTLSRYEIKTCRNLMCLSVCVCKQARLGLIF